MTPIELLRKLFCFSDVIDDYQLVAMVYQEAVKDRIYSEEFQKLKIPTYFIPKENNETF